MERFFANNDLYTYTVKRVIWERFAHINVEYAFRNRDKDVDLRPYKDRIISKIKELDGLGPTQATLEKLRGLGYLGEGFLEALSQFRIDTRHVEVGEVDGHVDIRIRGPWFQTIDLEVMVLQIVNEAVYDDLDTPAVRNEGDRRLSEKIDRIRTFIRENVNDRTHAFRIIEMGTRRAFKFDWHGHVIERLMNEVPEAVAGTSNVHWGEKMGLRLYGTFSHQGPMAMQALVPIHESQRAWFEVWNQVYKGRLGIALSDTLGTKQFYRDFDLGLAKLYDGARQDSGDPHVFGNEFIQHLEKMGIDPLLKTIVFSDSLNDEKSFALWKAFAHRIRPQFGIGTFLSNDMGIRSYSNVIKLVRVNGLPVCKLGDDPAKAQCEDPIYLEWVKHLIDDVLR